MRDTEVDLKSKITQKQIDELSAIYADYRYAVRKYEQVLQKCSIPALAAFQFERLHWKNLQEFPWKVRLLEPEEKQQFEDFSEEKIHHDTGKAYITLQHTNPAEDSTKPLTYVPQSYMYDLIDMNLPSSVERYTIVYPNEAQLGKTEFFIDGWLKATYTQEENAETPVYNGFCDEKIKTNFRILVNLIENSRRNKYEIDRRFLGLATNAFAQETVNHFENTILEILGSFAEKMQAISREITGEKHRKKAFKKAERNGLILSAENFIDYTNIRNLMRHQWDTMDELGYFHSAAADRNNDARNKYLMSYRRVCDKTLIQRMKTYVEILPQMQYIMQQLNPHVFIRGLLESNTKFAERLKQYSRQFPNRKLTVELNWPLESDKHKSLNKNLRKIIPQIEISDDYSGNDKHFDTLQEDYQRRSWFLQSFHHLECTLMSYSLTRGKNSDRIESWNYIKDNGIISRAEYAKWHKYSLFRNALSHNYYSGILRQKLRYIEEAYLKDLNALETRLTEIRPDVEWVKKGVYRHIHKDGLVVVLDMNDKTISFETKKPELSGLKLKGKIELPDEKKKVAGKKEEVYPNGVKYELEGNKIQALTLPSGVQINFEKQRIIFGSDVQFQANAENFNVLQTKNYKLFTDKGLRVNNFFEKNHKQPVRGGDTLLMEYKHRAVIDSMQKLKEFFFKKDDGNVSETAFKPVNDNVSVMLADGTQVLLAKNSVKVSHRGNALSFENRQAFVLSYNGSARILPPNGANGR